LNTIRGRPNGGKAVLIKGILMRAIKGNRSKKHCPRSPELQLMCLAWRAIRPIEGAEEHRISECIGSNKGGGTPSASVVPRAIDRTGKDTPKRRH